MTGGDDNDNRKRRDEPVGYIMPTAIKQLKAGGNAIVGGVSQGCDVPIYTAPQPAEPVLDKYQPCGCVICTCGDEVQCQGCGARHCGRHPIGELSDPVYVSAEPVNVPLDKAGAVGRAFSLVRRLKDGEPVEDELRQVIRQIAAEPVKVPSDKDLLDMWDEIAGTGKSDEALEFAHTLLARYR